MVKRETKRISRLSRRHNATSLKSATTIGTNCSSKAFVASRRTSWLGWFHSEWCSAPVVRVDHRPSRPPLRQVILRHQEKYSKGMENKYGPNWRQEHPEFDVAVLYEAVGRTPHGRLAIADEAISITKKQQVKTRARRSEPQVSARELRLEKEVKNLKRENKKYHGLERIMRAMAAKGGWDFDALVEEAAPDLATSESDVGFSRKHDTGGQHGIESDNTDRGNYGYDGEDSNNADGDDYEDYGHEGEDDGEYYGHDDDDYNNDGEYYGPNDDEDLW